MTVEYRDIPGYPSYFVGNDGSVWSRRRKRVVRMKPQPKRDGALEVGIRDEKGRHFEAVHRLVLLAFVGPCPEGKVCCHADDNPSKNYLSNLRWDTISANVVDAIDNGRFDGCRFFGQGITLSRQMAREIRHRASQGATQRQIVTEFGVSQQAVYRVLTRRTWKSDGPAMERAS